MLLLVFSLLKAFEDVGLRGKQWGKFTLLCSAFCFCGAEQERGSSDFFFSFLLVFTKSKAFHDNFQKKKSVVFISSRRRRRTRTKKRRAYPLFSSSATKRLFQLALRGERDDANRDRRMR